MADDMLKLFRKKNVTAEELERATALIPGRHEILALRRNKGYYPGEGEEFVNAVKEVIASTAVKGKPTAESIRESFNKRASILEEKPFHAIAHQVIYYGYRKAAITVGKNKYTGYILGFYSDENNKPAFIFSVVDPRDTSYRLDKSFRTTSVKSIELF